MKNVILTLATLVSLVVLVGCDEEPQHLPMLNAGNSEYLYVKPDQNVKGFDQNVKGFNAFHIGYSLRSTKDDRVLLTFRCAPQEVRLDDFDGDGVKDIVCIVPDQNVEGFNAFHIGYSMQVALGKGDGSFQQAKVVKTFKSIN